MFNEMKYRNGRLGTGLKSSTLQETKRKQGLCNKVINFEGNRKMGETAAEMLAKGTDKKIHVKCSLIHNELHLQQALSDNMRNMSTAETN
jgi:hypothetical protein